MSMPVAQAPVLFFFRMIQWLTLPSFAKPQTNTPPALSVAIPYARELGACVAPLDVAENWKLSSSCQVLGLPWSVSLDLRTFQVMIVWLFPLRPVVVTE